jgi:3-oxoacyl-[acyl-carrier protein] reductase
LVTGAGHGIGAAIALALAADGCDIAVHYGRSGQEAAAVAERVRGMGRQAVALQADLTVTEQADRLVAEAVEALGGLEVLVCNAGDLVARVPVADMPDDHYLQVVDVNLGATFRTVRAAIPHLRQAGPAGRVITMSSLAAHNGGGAGAAVYAAAKAGILGLSRGLAKELAPHGITVNSLAPGFIGETRFHEAFTPAQVQEAVIAGLPLRRAGSPAEVAGTVVWLASAAAGFVTGTTIDIDGGALIR